MSRQGGRERSVPGTAGDFMIPIDKSAGPTSRRVVDHLIRVLNRRDLGHAGTLDPFASGLLLVLAGRATKLVPFIHEWDKEYEAVIRLGESTDSLDSTGRIIARSAVAADVAARIPEAAEGLTGALEQTPPMLSAVRTGGVRLHALARQGLTVERTPRTRTVHDFQVTAIDLPDVHARVTCASGTYVRSLAESLGERLGLPSHLAELKRIRIGPFTLTAARPDSSLEAAGGAALAGAAIPLAGILSDWPEWRVEDEGEQAVRFGRIPAAAAPPGDRSGRFRVLGPGGDLLALIELRPAAEGGDRFLRAFVSSGDTR